MSSPELPVVSEAQLSEALAKILPAEENAFSVSEVRIPTPDGIELAGDLYQPDLPADTNPYGLIYVLGPYGRGGVMALLNAKCFAARRYAVLFVSCRGTGGSGGAFVAGMNEQADSQAVVKWMRQQPWYPGKFVTFGMSYLGFTQWALLRDPPEDLIASVNLCSLYDQSRQVWSNGMYRMDRIPWSYIVDRMGEATGGLASIINPAKLKAAFDSTPIYDATERFLDGRAQYVLDFMTTPNVEDPFWAGCKHSAAMDLVNIPILLRSGWYDTLALQTMEAYRRVRDRGLKVYLTIGPWTHGEACGVDSTPESLAFLDEHVAGRTKDHRPLSVKIFVTGAEEWRYLPSWPPVTEDRVFYLSGQKTVSAQPPAPDSPSLSFTYDPNNPTPTKGGPRMMGGGGRVDDSDYAARHEDVLVYTSDPLTDDLEVMGRPIVQLAHSTEVPYADLWIRLSEVCDSISHNLTENWQSLDGQERNRAPFSLALGDRAHVFKAGTSIRVIVAGGSFPLLARNPGTGVNRTRADELKAVKHTIQHGGGLSKLILPCSKR